MDWILILVIAASVHNGYAPAVTTQEFRTKELCLTAVRELQLQQRELKSEVRVSSYVCTRKS
jgi:hypothetical protein